jgi:hypothetical protein
MLITLRSIRTSQAGLYKHQYGVIMNGLSKLLVRTLFLTAALMFGGILSSYAADLQRIAFLLKLMENLSM